MNGHITRWIQAYHDRELSPARQKQVEEHLAGCLACHQELEQLRHLSALLQEAPLPASQESAEQFSARLKLRLPHTPPQRSRSPAWKASWGLVWLASPLLLAGAWMFGQALLALGNLALLAGMAKGMVPASALLLRLNHPLLGLLRLDGLGEFVAVSPWLAPATQIFLWVAASVSLTFFIGILVWGWVAGWWAEKRTQIT
jgi:anti-sigma factor RsiW